MIFLTENEKKKLEMIDTFFSYIDVPTLKAFAESEQVVGKLKGYDANNGIISNLFKSNSEMDQKIKSLETELSSIKNDLFIIVKALNKPFEQNIHIDFNILKNRLGVF